MKSTIIAIGFLTVAGLMALPAAPALAVVAPEWVQCEEALAAGTGQWSSNTCKSKSGELNWETREVTETMEATSSGEIEITDTKATGGESTLKCKETDVGWVGPLGTDAESTVTTSGCTRVSGLCEAGKTLVVKAVDLPWTTQLSTKEGKIRDTLTSAKGGGPGYAVECTVGGIFKGTDECTGTITAGIENSSSGGVQALFDKTTEGEKEKCTLGGAETGRIKGSVAIKTNNALMVLPGNLNGSRGVRLTPRNRTLRFNKGGSEKRSITILNTGDQFVALEKHKLEGTEAAGFAIVDPNKCLNKTLHGWVFFFGGGSCTLEIELVMAAAKAATYKGELLYEDGTSRDFIFNLSNP